MRQKGLKTEIVAWCLASAQAKAGDVKGCDFRPPIPSPTISSVWRHWSE